MSIFNPGKKRLPNAILAAGAVVATLIALGTTLSYLASGGKNPVRLLHFVASGILGKDALAKEIHTQWTMVMLGLLLHLLISTGWTSAYFILHGKIKLLSKHWLFSGIAYGVVIWSAMTFIVMPLSRAPAVPFKMSGALIDLLIIILCAGLPVTLMAKRHFGLAMYP